MIEIVKLEHKYIDQLIEFYYRNEPYFKWFNPHPFTRHYLENLIDTTVEDGYYLIVSERVSVIGYGMLRGIDEGYEIPTLGIAIDKQYQGVGLGRAFIKFLHCICKLDWIDTVRIGVMKENKIAKALYEDIGYLFTEDKGDREYGYIYL